MEWTVKKRHERKRRRGLFTREDANSMKDRLVSAAKFLLYTTEGRRFDQDQELIAFTPTASTRKLIESMLLVARLLQMPGDKNKYRLAKLLVAENCSSNQKSAERTIEDALAAVHRMQAADNGVLDIRPAGGAPVLGICFGANKAVRRKYGIRHVGA